MANSIPSYLIPSSSSVSSRMTVPSILKIVIHVVNFLFSNGLSGSDGTSDVFRATMISSLVPGNLTLVSMTFSRILTWDELKSTESSMWLQLSNVHNFGVAKTVGSTQQHVRTWTLIPYHHFLNWVTHLSHMQWRRWMVAWTQIVARKTIFCEHPTSELPHGSYILGSGYQLLSSVSRIVLSNLPLA